MIERACRLKTAAQNPHPEAQDAPFPGALRAWTVRPELKLTQLFWVEHAVRTVLAGTVEKLAKLQRRLNALQRPLAGGVERQRQLPSSHSRP